jgi:hypothetical protein
MQLPQTHPLPPKLEDFTPQTNLADFMRKGVPQALRLAALRKAWVLDPAIRDFVNDARDYAYDWNTPGGAPGYGPLNATPDEVKAMLRQVMGEAEPKVAEDMAQEASLPESGSPEASLGETIQANTQQQDEQAQDEQAQDEQAKDEAGQPPQDDVASLKVRPEQHDSHHESAQEMKAPSEAYASSRRRHGSAAPR